jgi:hypothetical protein
MAAGRLGPAAGVPILAVVKTDCGLIEALHLLAELLAE